MCFKSLLLYLIILSLPTLSKLLSYLSVYFQDIVDGLKARGHKTNQMDSAGSTVQGIEVDEDGTIHAYADPRKAGGVSGF